MLTPDINRKIACYLFIDDLHSLFLTNKSLNKLSRDERFWQLKLEWDYNVRGSLLDYKGFHYRTITRFSSLSERQGKRFVKQCNQISDLLSDHKVIEFNVSNITCHTISEWNQIIKKVKTLSVPYIGFIVAFLKHLLKYSFPTSMNLVFLKRDSDYAVKFTLSPHFSTGIMNIDYIIDTAIDFPDYNTFTNTETSLPANLGLVAGLSSLVYLLFKK